MTNTMLTEVSSIGEIRALNPTVAGVKGINLKDAAVQQLAEFLFLEELDLSGCEDLTDRAVIELHTLPRLRALDLSLCGLITDHSVIALSRLPVLQSLSLNWCYGVTDTGLTQLARCPSLEAISLWSCEEVTDAGVESLSHLPKLRQLELPEFARITDAGLNALSGNAPHLEILRLDHLTGVSDIGISSLRSLKELTKLIVQGCQSVTEAGIAALQAALPTCRIIFR